MNRGRGRSSSYAASDDSSTSHPDGKFRQNQTRSFRDLNQKPPQTRNPTTHVRDLDSRDGKSGIGSQRAVLRHEDEERELADAPSIIGNCPFMCPERERAQRERLRDLAIFERLHGNPGKSSPNLAVKKFCRTISIKNVQGSDVRPLPVLEATLNHLLELFNSSEHPFEVIHDFISDRTRSIRQDLSMQHIINDQAISMYEKMVKFHVNSHHRLRKCAADDPTVASIHHLNAEQLIKSLSTLYNLYDVNRNSNSTYENEAEFRSLHVLLHLGSHRQLTGEPLALWFRQLPASVIKSKMVAFARRVLRFYQIGNYWRFFFTVAAEATYLQFCIIEPYANEVRAKALACVNQSGYKPHPYPLSKLSKILRMQEADMESFCNSYGLETSVDETGNKVLPSKQTTFCKPKEGFHNYEFLGLEKFHDGEYGLPE